MKIIPLRDVHNSSKSWKILLENRGLSGDEKLEYAWLEVMVEIFEVFQTKQHDYGPSNISDMGINGVMTRVYDKVARLKQLSTSTEPQNESLEDTWIDLTDYGVIALLVRRLKWPLSKENKNDPTNSSARFDQLIAEIEIFLHASSISKKDLNDLLRKYSPEKALEKL